MTVKSGIPLPFAKTATPTATMGLVVQMPAVKDYEPDSKTIDEVLFTVDDLSKSFSPATSHYQGLHVLRPQNPLRYQVVADSLPDGDLGKQTVDLCIADTSPNNLDMRLASAVSMLCSNWNLPEELLSMVSTDAVHIGQAMARFLPQASSLEVKLENVGTNRCPRWHQDSCVARAIVSYSGEGTEYTNDGNIDFWELNHGGNNDHILRDKSMTRCVGCGNILLMKGLLYPGEQKGLVHKSPETQYHATGDVKKRLVLKVDVE